MKAKSVLFVDDEVPVLNALKRLVGNLGYEVLTRDSPLDALALLKSRPINVIVSDYRMPKMTGAEFLREARQLRPDSVRLVLSGYADAQVVTEMIEQGEIFRFLMKPWDAQELKNAIMDGFAHQERMSFLKA
jgi:response regulator RpfG family c-di-GMP phosphodiesterase